LKRTALLAVVALLAVLAAPVQASGDDPAPRLDAAAWYLLGADGAVLAQQSSRRKRPIASITKLMTALVTLERTRPSDVVRVSAQAAGVGGSTMFLRAGEELTIAELVRGTLVPSANDAATALALHVGEGSISRFVDLMNEKARALGLTDTTFVNPHGLDEPGHVSSARDVTLLVRQALGVPFIRDAHARASVVVSGGRRIPTTDDLLASWAPFVGGKTGHTDGAGWSEAGSAAARGVTVYGAVLGTESRTARNEALQALLGHGLASYRRIAAIDSSRVYARTVTGYGRPDAELVPARTVVRIVRAERPLLERVVAPASVGLPVRAGEKLGRVEVWDGDRLVASSNLVAAEPVSEPGLVGKAAWFLEQTGEHLWELLT
jgi:D-alanyl-D-alanine carboxypeptidase (penicillin-binding protein 5/6)